MTLRARRGIAIVNVLVFAVFTTVFITAGVSFTQAAMKQGRNAKSNAQVYNVALAGITHAVSWLQKQTVQPVTVFDPLAENASTPDEDAETRASEEQLGLVNEFVIDSARQLWGRYEVGRSPNAPARGSVSQAGAHSSLYTDPIIWCAEDVSRRRGSSVDGSVWRVRSRGYVFLRPNPSDAFSPTGTPTKIVDSITLEAEASRKDFSYRAAALYAWSDDESCDISFDENGGIDARLQVDAGPAKAYWTKSGSPCIDGWAGLSYSDDGSTSVSDDNTMPDVTAQYSHVFGVGTVDEIKALADTVYTSINDVPAELPACSFVFLDKWDNEFVFNDSKPLSGGGILFVNGDLKLDGNNTLQTWEGLIFVRDTLKLEKKVTITGSVMADNVVMISDTGKQAKVAYDKGVLDTVMATLGSYRLERSTLRSVGNAPEYRF